MLAPDESAAGKRNGARLNWYLGMHGWCLNYVNHLAYNSNRHFGHLSTTAAVVPKAVQGDTTGCHCNYNALYNAVYSCGV